MKFENAFRALMAGSTNTTPPFMGFVRLFVRSFVRSFVNAMHKQLYINKIF